MTRSIALKFYFLSNVHFKFTSVKKTFLKKYTLDKQ